MTTSKTEICNMALARVGVSKYIDNVDTEETAEAVNCRLFYNALRDEVTEAVPWGFATVYASAQLVEESPNDEWVYSYKYPVNCLHLQRIVYPGGDRSGKKKIPYEFGYDENGKLIYTDQEEAVLKYTRRINTEGHFSPSFVNMLAWRLAMELSTPLARKQKFNELQKQYLISKSDAMAIALNQEQKDEEPDADYTEARL